MVREVAAELFLLRHEISVFLEKDLNILNCFYLHVEVDGPLQMRLEMISSSADLKSYLGFLMTRMIWEKPKRHLK